MYIESHFEGARCQIRSEEDYPFGTAQGRRARKKTLARSDSSSLCLFIAWMIKVRLPEIAVPFRKWRRWEWIAFAIVALIELTVVIVVAGHRWPRLYDEGVFLKALPWAFSEFMFGFNQEFVFRGPLMSGLLRFTGPWWASISNTLLFLIGPLHGLGLWKMLDSNPTGAVWLLSGVVATGLFFSWLRYRTDNVVLCGVLHGIVNGFLNGAGFARRAYSLEKTAAKAHPALS